MMLSTNKAKWPCRGRDTETSHGSTGANRILVGSRMGNGILEGCVHDAVIVLWGHNVLLAMSRVRSIMISIIMHHSAGLKAAPNVNQS